MRNKGGHVGFIVHCHEDAQRSYCLCLVFAETVGNVATLIAQSCGGMRAVGHVSEVLTACRQ
jgi:hypothetical protein